MMAAEGHGMKKGASRRAAASGAAPVGGLPAPLVGLDLEVRRTEREQTTEALRRGRTPLTLIALADDGTRLAEEAVARAVHADPPPSSACREGCDWCCHLTVGTVVPEVARVVDHLRQTLSAEELRATAERVARLDEQRRRLGPSRRADARLPCALLVNRRCSVYPVRPLTCRGFNSSDAGRCEQFVTGRARVSVPLYAPQQRLMTFTLDGMRAGLAASGLNGDLLELTAALRIALEVPGAIDRWLAGEPVFAPARLD
jgi:Fe-S-cluster containining protein